MDMVNIYKSFHNHPVLKNVDFTLRAGEIHALMGENGAGKSTLMKILNGIYTKDHGKIFILDKEQEIDSPKKAASLGIAMIHQELNLVPELTVMENMFLGREFVRGKSGWIDWERMKSESQKWLDRLGVQIDPACKVGDLSVGQQQMVEIAKALSMRAKILVLDEPTSALTNHEIEMLFEVMLSLKKQGVGMIYISHRMEEIFRICDRITVLRDGTYIGTRKTSETNIDEIVQMMVGREITDWYPRRKVELGEERIRVEQLSDEKVKEIQFSIRSGEVLGIAGLMGAGRTEIANLLFGVSPKRSGTIWLDGKEVKIKNPIDAIRQGIAYVTEDRKQKGLILTMSMEENLTLTTLKSLAKYGWIQRESRAKLTDDLIQELKIRPQNKDLEVRYLSGGNQQKVVLGKWIATKPKVLILDEPTRGVDIGAKAEIYQLINRLAGEGVAVLLISSDLPELLKMSDRVLVMSEGRITGEFTREEVTQEKVMKAASSLQAVS